MSTPDTPTSVPSELPRSGTATTVHNHGSEDGPGLACREHRVDGRLVGECLSPAAVSREDAATPDDVVIRMARESCASGKDANRPDRLYVKLRAVLAAYDRQAAQLTASRSRVAALEADAERLDKLQALIAPNDDQGHGADIMLHGGHGSFGIGYGAWGWQDHGVWPSEHANGPSLRAAIDAVRSAQQEGRETRSPEGDPRDR